MNSRFLPLQALSALALAMACPAAPAEAQYACAETVGEDAGRRPYDNPCPDLKTDIMLPMPGGKLFMAFREVVVPGPEYWGNRDRRVILGDPRATIFETRRAVTVAGSFPSKDGRNWRIILGKYEVTLAQFATVMGDGDLDAGLKRMKAEAGEPVYFDSLLDGTASEADRRKLLASPVRGMRERDYRTFIQDYTDWCLQDRMCRFAMPRYGGTPGFLRLPTEIEWEYAARSGPGTYELDDPFGDEDPANFAYISSGAASREREGPTTIGRHRPTRFGIYDLYGNVMEMADGRFSAELVDGKAGMFVVRGGSYRSRKADLRPSRREELDGYREVAGGAYVPLRSQTTGIRLAIGSLARPEGTESQKIEAGFAEYTRTSGLLSPAARSTRAEVLDTVEPLNRIDELVVQIVELNPNMDVAELNKIIEETEQARRTLLRTTESLAGQQARNTIRDAAEAGRAVRQLRQISARLEAARRPGAIDALRQQIPALERQYQGYQGTVQFSLEQYVIGIQMLESYGPFATEALKRIGGQDLKGLDKVAYDLVASHLADLSDGGDPEAWKTEIIDVFSDPGIDAVE